MAMAVTRPDLVTTRHTIKVEQALWGCRVAVRVEPATCRACYREFGDHAAAMAFAEELANIAGWPIRDASGGGA